MNPRDVLLTVMLGFYALAMLAVGIGQYRMMRKLGYRLSKYWLWYERDM